MHLVSSEVRGRFECARHTTITKKHFSRYKKPAIELPDLSEVQLASYEWFVEKGLKELLGEISPIKGYSGKELALELDFLDYYVDQPKFTENHAKEHNLSFEAPLRMKVRLTNKKTNEIKEQEVYMGDFPLMTERGTFIVNGVERVVVSQLIRSPGVYFIPNKVRGKKYFGAKIIPNRGAWLEFETDIDGSIHVRIDRKRKVAASVLLRTLGLASNEEILAKFTSLDNDALYYVHKTLERDPAKTRDEAFIEVYKRIRPGELAAVDNARSLIEAMFSFDRYDLAPVGRFKFNQRLALKRDPQPEQNRILSLDDIVAVFKEIIHLNQNQDSAIEDDIDHLGNRRVRGVGELLQNKLRVGVARMSRIIRDRMSTYDIYTLTPAHLINARPFMASIKEFFTSSQLSQFMDQVNPLAELEHRRRLSAMGPGGLTRERAGFEVRDVHPSHYGRICPIQTPEGQNIGLVGHLAGYARINDLGLIETPYQKVTKGKITKEVHYLDAAAEANVSIAHAGIPFDEDGNILEEKVEARVRGNSGLIEREQVDYIDISPQQFISIATSLIPFFEHDDANRTMMGSNMQRQAVPCVRAEAPLVSTGVEERAARDSGRVVLADDDGVIAEADAQKIVLKTKKGEEFSYPLDSFLRTNQFTAISHKPIVIKHQQVKRGDVLADGSSVDNGKLALGKNLLVAFVSWYGSNYEDAIILSERLVRDETFTSIHIEDYVIDVRDTKLGAEETSPDIPNVSEEKLRNLDEEGIIRIGAEVRSGDILTGKISPKGESDLTPEEKLLRAIFGEKARDVKDTSLTLPHGKHGRIVGIKVFSRDKGDKLDSGVIKRIQVEVAQLRKISVGDKLAGRHGNKGVISKILPEEDMPYLADGRPVDIILNPLGVASRMNIGQILETHLGWAAHTLGYQAITPALAGVTEDEIHQELKKANLPENGKVELYDGLTGEKFYQDVTVGYIYIMKLIHLVEDKIHMRSVGPYSLITQQPLGGKAQFGGQRFGEMEVWALEGYGAAHTLQEMLTIKSDDVLGRSATYESIISGEKIKKPNLPSSFHVLLNELKGLALNVELAGGQIIPESTDEYGEEARAPEPISKREPREKERARR
ncbi:MAG: DNA-directed RNA polymerase subunit beta [Candidatus Sungbacteria bacterium RIFCSPLOWO2_02_FULL_51_17]|uniref:DNA-directed RNA polymerase subunit beta n=1 Tax=Candidatus Sungbacteria bacterium RIFCSPHIGHO2_02_FULL_51_29 TaxID=1802273 RepID=A0A1G2KS32_9BACT|nr:MAG: DNA-directed RNA polymerase subunit beta [Candidatus Sungbacteria bacterium RIFCSPHIGHO2_01_FULL_51_22]OHA01219.1 MAG: DNA-directed RNA polymerase subunit beta [Candidatus Sungbacteria bacterium RIFCSPHIGHO2_02_FULL_51_29]OHA04604.1 MAG: DNA-directed RNA polymerase subunit beta [Candidatus Sungbacteria bacterium RIFCSPLOWO2_01_FULL_51_34]OHA12291.1 MAG: DNA-directed RNA polymerase subunit beta [Candidatus Sungbacteria bacterium RIFCSPLOWO2_02_FULL_51_17]